MLGSRVGLVFAGPTDGRVRSLVEQSLDDASGDAPVRTRALKLPIDLPSLRRALARRPALAALATERRLGDLGKRLGHDFAPGGDSPALEALSAAARRGAVRERCAAARRGRRLPERAAPQSGATAQVPRRVLLRPGLRRHTRGGCGAAAGQGLRDRRVLAGNLSTVDDLDTEAGRLALVLLLSGAAPGSYGLKKSADDGVLPAIPAAAEVNSFDHPRCRARRGEADRGHGHGAARRRFRTRR